MLLPPSSKSYVSEFGIPAIALMMCPPPTKGSSITSLRMVANKEESMTSNKGKGRMICIGVIRMGWLSELPIGMGKSKINTSNWVKEL
jgi:hypothetical protein